MIHKAIKWIIPVTLIFAGCYTQKSGNKENVNAGAGKLVTRLQIAARSASTESAFLLFTVVNNTDKAQRFCKWETPFEPRLGKYFEIVDNQGNEATFKGAMARRVMPPPPEAYMIVPAHGSVKTTINLANNYELKAKKYTVSYTGGGVSGLNAGNLVKLNLKRL
ncbi:protease [Mucilaginibacter sp. PAMB04168]|uniref:protease n=1 Tax=Mucilaginibacter sp. PAMB04168 TaxID=3138567 RepID=UPI0031F692A7